MLKLPDINELENLTNSKTSNAYKNIETTEQILKRLLENIESFKKLELQNQELRTALLTNQNLIKKEVYNKLLALSQSIQDKQKLNERKHKTLLREYEEAKLELGKQLFVEKERTKFLTNKYRDLESITKKLLADNQQLNKYNKLMLAKIAVLERHSLANEKNLHDKTQHIKNEFDENLKNFAAHQLDKEISYKAKIESLNADLTKYFEQTKQLKEKYYSRELELRKKIQELLS